MVREKSPLLVMSIRLRQDGGAAGMVVQSSYNQLLISRKGAHKLGWARSGFSSSVS
jgi:hypothetical protein